MQARSLMKTDVETVQHDETVGEVLQKLARRPFNGFPVVDDEGRLAGIVTQRDLVDIFEPSDRTIWIPIGLPPFLETVEYAVDVSWDDLDLGIDMATHANDPISSVMTRDVVTVSPDADLDEVLAILTAEEPDINRIPVTSDGFVEGIITRQDVLAELYRQRKSKA